MAAHPVQQAPAGVSVDRVEGGHGVAERDQSVPPVTDPVIAVPVMVRTAVLVGPAEGRAGFDHVPGVGAAQRPCELLEAVRVVRGKRAVRSDRIVTPFS